MSEALRSRLLAALGLTVTAAGAAFAEAPPSPPPAARWDVSYARTDNPPRWCLRGSARCEATGPRCAPSIRVPRGCTPGTACTDENELVDAPLQQAVTQEQRRRVPQACCYDLPRHCVPPWAGRALRGEDGAELRARPEAGLGWGAPAEAPSRPGYWTSLGLREHAAVASFAQTVLRLLRFGAPAALVEQTLRAGLDEVSHATQCFARAYEAGEGAVRPGALSAASLADDDTLPRFALDTLYEGCVAETLGALDAGARARGLEGLEGAALWQRLADEEAAHAELAWRTLRWALHAEGDRVGAALRAARERLAAHASVCEGAPAAEERDGLRAVVLPCLDALLASAAA